MFVLCSLLPHSSVGVKDNDMGAKEEINMAASLFFCGDFFLNLVTEIVLFERI